jgi:hypothetical protein
MPKDKEDDLSISGEIRQLPWLLRWILRLLPVHDNSSEAQLRWRIRVGVTLIIVTFGFILRTFIDYGLWPASLVYAGFAQAADLQQIAAREVRKEERDLDTDILDLRIKHCVAQSPEAKQLYWSKIAPLMTEYFKLTGRTYALPPCADL